MPTPLAPTWDLRDLFDGMDDPHIQETVTLVETKAKQFDKTYREKLKQSPIDPAMLKQAFADYEEIWNPIHKLSSYAQLIFSTDATNPTYGAFLQKTSEIAEQTSQATMFFDLGIMQWPDTEFTRLLAHSDLAERRHYLQRLQQQKPHILSEAEEKILSQKSLTSSQAFARFFQEENSDMKVHIEGKTEPVSETSALKELYSPDRETRRLAAEGFSKALEDNGRRFTFIYNMLVQDKKMETSLRKFSSPEASRHLANETTQQAVDALSKANQNHLDIVQNYYQLKKKLLGLDELREYDRYAPLPNKETKLYSFDEARDIILTAFGAFHPRFAETAKLFFDQQWIDAAERPGKRGGAYCMFVTPDAHPYVFVNYSGQSRDVMTLAHELGHAIHAYFAKKQNLLDFSPPLTICETASIFGEMLVFDHLKREAKSDQERLALNMQKLEEIFASTFRQMSMYQFEQRIHDLIRTQGELSTQMMNSQWLETQKEMFGQSVTLGDQYASWWSYISHFFEAPFYVYAYAFGELLTLSLYQVYKSQGASIIEKYLTFLEAGGSKSPDELTSSLGFDLSDPAFWDQGFMGVKTLLDETMRLSQNM